MHVYVFLVSWPILTTILYKTKWPRPGWKSESGGSETLWGQTGEISLYCVLIKCFTNRTVSKRLWGFRSQETSSRGQKMAPIDIFNPSNPDSKCSPAFIDFNLLPNSTGASEQSTSILNLQFSARRWQHSTTGCVWMPPHTHTHIYINMCVFTYIYICIYSST